jgi:hypothetical protein
MSPRHILLACAASVTLAAAAFAQTAVPAPPFNAIELRGGGHIVIKHGAVQRVTLIEGSTQYTSIHADSSDPRKLIIDACNDNCPMHYNLEIEIVTPGISGVAIKGGGDIESSGDFPGQRAIAAAVKGGGKIDLRSIGAADATAAVNGGGDIDLRAADKLTAAVNGGGKITYWGDPKVTEAVNGGGEIGRGS